MILSVAEKAVFSASAREWLVRPTGGRRAHGHPNEAKRGYEVLVKE